MIFNLSQEDSSRHEIRGDLMKLVPGAQIASSRMYLMVTSRLDLAHMVSLDLVIQGENNLYKMVLSNRFKLYY